MPVRNRKYSWTGVLAILFFLQGILWGGCGRMNYPTRTQQEGDPAATTAPGDRTLTQPAPSMYENIPEEMVAEVDSIGRHDGGLVVLADSLITDSLTTIDTLIAESLRPDSLAADSLARRGPRYDSLGRRDYGKSYLDEVISGQNRDSVKYDVRTGMIYVYNQAEVIYGNTTFKGDFLEVSMEDKMLRGKGVLDTAGVMTRPILIDNGHEYDLDSVNYDLGSGKAKVRGVWTTEGDGFLRAAVIKKMPDNSFNVDKGTYTTCDADHPHFYFRMKNAKVLPGDKTIFGYTYLVIEDVPLPFLGLPFGFFPMNNERTSGFIMPSVGEEFTRGFYLREGGYYFAPNDYIDMTLLGGIYTKGSWETRLTSRYRKRYRYSGNLDFDFASNKFGDTGSLDWSDEKTFGVRWSHAQDPKFKPGQTFSASVNFQTSKKNKYNPTSLQDFANNQTSSTVSFQKNWIGTPLSLGVTLRHDQTNRDSTHRLTFPSLNFNVSRINPFKFKNRKPGPERWYEKISLSYSNSMVNQVPSVKENLMFTKEMFDRMETSATHNLPINASFSLFNYINITPNFTYRENWNTKKVERHWDNATEQSVQDTVRGFYRVYDYSGSVSANTTIYGMYDRFSPRSKIQAVRHTMEPSVGFSFHPGFGDPKHGFYAPYQINANGDIGEYSPYQHMSPPGKSTQASLNFRMRQTLEAKVRSDSDSTGLKKVKIIDDLSFNFSYNFMAEEFKLSRSVPVTFRSTLIKGFNINLTTALGLYAIEDGRYVDKLLWTQGKLPRIESLQTSFNWSKSFGKGDSNARNTGSNLVNQNDPYLNQNPFDPLNPYTDPTLQQMQEQDEQDQQANYHAYRNLLSSQYYDFSVPFNVNFRYNIRYDNTLTRSITQTCGFGVSFNITPQWGITFDSGYDFKAKQLIPTSSFNLTRDLHCMQMTFNWVPIGPLRSWNFHISVKANVLRDLKYEKSGSRYDELLY